MNELSYESDLFFVAVYQAFFETWNQMQQRSEDTVFPPFPGYPLVSEDTRKRMSEFKLGSKRLIRLVGKFTHPHDPIVKEC
jgi:hypothetical protein